MKRVTGIGGIFFKWGGAAFEWVDSDGKPTGGTTAWAIDPEGDKVVLRQPPVGR